MHADPARLSRQELRAAVNYGVASLARALRAPADELLALRCECGDALCAGVVWISLDGYELTRAGPGLLVALDHDRPPGNRGGGRVVGDVMEGAA